MKPIPAERFAKAIHHIVTEALTSHKWHGELNFPIPEPPSIKWVDEPTDVEVPYTLDLYRFHWYKNVGAGKLDWKLYGPKGFLKGSIGDELFYKYDIHMVLTFLTDEIVSQAVAKQWIKDDTKEYYHKYKKHQQAKSWGAGDAQLMADYVVEYHPPGGQDYADSGDKLARVIPGMLYRIPETECPHTVDVNSFCEENPRANSWNFMNLVIHLNDYHKWPRSADDKPPNKNWDMSRNIADWSEEYALKHNLDMNFRTPEEVERAKKQKPISKLSDMLEGGYDPELLVGKVAKVVMDPGVPTGTVYFIENEDSLIKESPSKSLKEAAKDWSKKYDHLLNGKWKDVLGEPGSGEGA